MMPWIRTSLTSQTIMLWVIIALLPGIALQSYFFGVGVIIQIVLASIAALLFEGIFLRLRQRPLTPLSDYSALLTAILLAISIPSYAPWWMVVIGIGFAIIIAKQVYGGLGHNIFNPAMTGYVVLLIAFPINMTDWPAIYPHPSWQQSIAIILAGAPHQVIDAVSQATPLDSFRTHLHMGWSVKDNLAALNSQMASAWQWINMGYLLGGLLLLYKRIISWHIPVSLLFCLLIISAVHNRLFADAALPLSLVLGSGATLLGAFFIATDPVTAATTRKGKLIFGAIIGLLVYLIRNWGGYPEGMAFAVLLANLLVPLIDYYTQPRVYGH